MTARSVTGHGGRPQTAAERYLLFAGTQLPPNGGLGDLLGTFTSEEEARRAFRDVRLRLSSPTSWAQLAVVDDRHGLTPMCWFGIGAEPRRHYPPRGRSEPLSTTPVPPRPRAVTLAGWLLAFVFMTDLAGPLLPSSGGNIVFGVAAAVLTGMAAWGVAMTRRWGLIAALVVATLTLLSDAPAIVIGSTGLIKVWATAAVLVCALIVVLVARVQDETGR